MQKIDFEKVSRNFPLCFNKDCPSYDRCLRFIAGQQRPDTMRYHLCIVPHELQGDSCEHFLSMEPVRVAYGFLHSYDEVLKRDFTAIRLELTDYLSNKGGYYKYLRGEWALMPNQQRHIESVFRRYGYEGKVKYDRIEEVMLYGGVPY